MKAILSIALILMGFFGITAVNAPCKGEEIYDIDYLLVDKTKTPWGHKFFKTFQELWKPPQGLKGYFITVGERKVSVRQSWVYVKVGDNIFNYEVYTSLLKPTMGEIDMQKKALTAARRTLMFLLKNYYRLKLLEKEL